MQEDDNDTPSVSSANGSNQNKTSDYEPSLPTSASSNAMSGKEDTFSEKELITSLQGQVDNNFMSDSQHPNHAK